MKAQVITVDCDYLRPQFAAAFIRTTPEGEIAIVENNTAHAVPLILKTLALAGAKPAQVRYLLITHVHLDHAGGTSALLEACPNATVLAHPRAARHLLDPSKLIAGAQAVYGEARFLQLYGTLSPIPRDRLREMNDGETLTLGRSSLEFIHTRGHAKHHLVLHDPDAQSVFTVDAFGLAYPSLQRNGAFVFASTSPTDFEPEEALKSIDRIISLETPSAHLTHYGEIRDLRSAAAQLRRWIEASARLVETYRHDARTSEALATTIESELQALMTSEFSRHGLSPTSADRELVARDLELNAQGLDWVAKKEPA